MRYLLELLISQSTKVSPECTKCNHIVFQGTTGYLRGPRAPQRTTYYIEDVVSRVPHTDLHTIWKDPAHNNICLQFGPLGPPWTKDKIKTSSLMPFEGTI